MKLRFPQAERLLHWRPAKHARVAAALALLALVPLTGMIHFVSGPTIEPRFTKRMVEQLVKADRLLRAPGRAQEIEAEPVEKAAEAWAGACESREGTR